MHQAQELAGHLLSSEGFVSERFERTKYWVRHTDVSTRLCVAVAAGYVDGEVLFGLWTEKVDLFAKYLSHGQPQFIDMAHAQLAKRGLHRLGTSGLRGWTSSEAVRAVEALKVTGLPWLEHHSRARTLLAAVMAGEREGPAPSRRRWLGMLGAGSSTQAAPSELVPADLQCMGNLYLELGQLTDACRCYSEFAARTGFTAESNPHRRLWLDALAALRSEAGL